MSLTSQSPTKPVKIMLCGASGALGQAIERCVVGQDGCSVVARYDRVGGFGDQPLGDVIIDVSHFSQTSDVVDFAVSHQCPLLVGTTGLTDKTLEQMAVAAEHVAICRASNFSLGALVLGQLVKTAAAHLPQWEVAIEETHHVNKKDAPSGTALTLQNLIASVNDQPVSIQSHRQGEVVGVHEVVFRDQTECLVLRHEVTDRAVFAKGAVWMAQRLAGAAPGLYSPEALLLTPSSH